MDNRENQDQVENQLQNHVRQTEFKSVLALARDKIEKESLEKIKEEFNLREFDSLWSLIGIMQMYLRTVENFNEKTKDSVYEAVKSFGKKGGIIQIGNSQKVSPVNYFFLAAAMLLFGSLTFTAGVLLSGTSPAWLTGEITTVKSPFATVAYLILNAPAGWILCLILSVPSFYYLKTYYVLFKLSSTHKEEILNLSILAVLICLVIIALVIFVKIMF